MERNETKTLCQSEHQKVPPRPKHTRLKMFFFSSGNSYGAASCYDEHQMRYIRHAECAAHRIAAHLPAEIEGVRTHASTSLLRMCAGVLCLASNGDWCSRSLKSC